MILDVPFTYVACIVRPRCRNEEEVRVRDREPVKIEEVTSAQAPRVASVTPPFTSVQTHFHAHRGAFWVPGSVTAAGLPDGVRRGQYAPLKVREPDTGLRLLERHEPVRERRGDDRAAYAQRIHTQAAELLIIDGVVCKRTPPPGWELKADRADPVIEAKEVHRPGPRAYRADRLADAVAHLRALAPPRDGGRIHIHGKFENLVPEAFAAIDDDWLGFRAAAQAFVAHHAHSVGHWSRPLANAYLDLRDALAAPDTGFAVEALDLGRALAALPAAGNGFDPAKHALLAEAVRRADREFLPAEPSAPPTWRR